MHTNSGTSTCIEEIEKKACCLDVEGMKKGKMV